MFHSEKNKPIALIKCLGLSRIQRLIILIGFLMLLFSSGISFSNETVFLCNNDNGTEREFELKINLNKKLLHRAGALYNIVEQLEKELIAKSSNKIGGVLYETTLTFNRLSGNLKYQSYKMDGSKVEKDNANYSCKKRLI
jgi:hypothetical protein